MLARQGASKREERTLVGKCPPPDIAAARKSLYFCIRQETPEACKRVPLLQSACVQMVSPVICKSRCWHRCSLTGQATLVGENIRMYTNVKKKQKKKGAAQRNPDVKVMLTHARLTQGGGSHHYYMSISAHCVLWLDILLIHSWQRGDLLTVKHRVSDLATISENSPRRLDMIYIIQVAIHAWDNRFKAARCYIKRHEQAAFELLI